MKEATGELNITVITVVAIAAIAAFFYAFIWPTIKNNLNRQTLCASAFNCGATNNDGTRTCSALNDKGNTVTVSCRAQDTSVSTPGT